MGDMGGAAFDLGKEIAGATGFWEYCYFGKCCILSSNGTHRAEHALNLYKAEFLPAALLVMKVQAIVLQEWACWKCIAEWNFGALPFRTSKSLYDTVVGWKPENPPHRILLLAGIISAHWPERLYRAFIINMPGFFSKRNDNGRQRFLLGYVKPSHCCIPQIANLNSRWIETPLGNLQWIYPGISPIAAG